MQLRCGFGKDRATRPDSSVSPCFFSARHLPPGKQPKSSGIKAPKCPTRPQDDLHSPTQPPSTPMPPSKIRSPESTMALLHGAARHPVATELGALAVGFSVHIYCVRHGLCIGDGDSVAFTSTLVYAALSATP
ncbi:unnamed protein product [Urochloa humidicola]